MASAVSKATLISDIWKNFFDRIKDQVKNVTLVNGTTVTIPTTSYAASFPDNLIDSKSDYPIIVVEDPETPTEPLTVGKTMVNGTITVGIYANQAEAASKFLSKVLNAIETYKGDLSSVGIRMVEVADIDQDSFSRNKIKVHYREVTFDFTYFYNKTGGF